MRHYPRLIFNETVGVVKTYDPDKDVLVVYTYRKNGDMRIVGVTALPEVERIEACITEGENLAMAVAVTSWEHEDPKGDTTVYVAHPEDSEERQYFLRQASLF